MTAERVNGGSLAISHILARNSEEQLDIGQQVDVSVDDIQPVTLL